VTGSDEDAYPPTTDILTRAGIKWVAGYETNRERGLPYIYGVFILTDAETGRPMAHLLIENVTAGYGGAPIVNEASASVGLGEIVTIVGPNGAGKSTFLKAVVGMIPASSGRVLIGDEDVTNMHANHLARRGLGYVPQVNDVFDTLTVVDNLAMGGYLLGKSETASRTEAVPAFLAQHADNLRRGARGGAGGGAIIARSSSSTARSDSRAA